MQHAVDLWNEGEIGFPDDAGNLTPLCFSEARPILAQNWLDSKLGKAPRCCSDSPCDLDSCLAQITVPGQSRQLCQGARPDAGGDSGSDEGQTDGAVPETDAQPEPEDSPSESSGCEGEDGGSSCDAAPAQCTDFATPGCIDFQGAIESGGDSRNTAAGSLSIDLGSGGYCLQSPCEFEDCYVCPHLDTAFPEGATVTATATPSAGSVFAQWGQGACAGQGPTCTFVAVKPSCITAQFLLQNPTAPPQSLPDASCAEDPTAP
jgi:hypothetical protein